MSGLSMAEIEALIRQHESAGNGKNAFCPPKEKGTGQKAFLDDVLPSALILSAAEYALNPVPPTQWHVVGLVPDTCVVQVTGAPKGGGKTTFVAHAVKALVTGTPFLSHETTKTNVLYLSEQPRHNFEPEYLEPLGLMKADNLYLLYAHLVAHMKWPDIVDLAVSHAISHDCKIIVVDTFARFAGLDGDKENSSGHVQQAMKPLQNAAASKGLTFVIVHHDRKSGGEAYNSGRGSNAFQGAVDVIVQFQRDPSNRSVRKISVEGRYKDLYENLMVELVDGEYIAMGTASQYAVNAALRKLHHALPIEADSAWTLKEILDHTQLKRSTLQRALDKDIGRGEIACTGTGRKGSPKRFYLNRI